MSAQHTIPALKLKKISKTYTQSRVAANKDISVDIFPGEIFSIIGENGAGKSTLLNILSGEILPDSGTLYVSGRECVFANPGEAQKAGIGMVHQHPRIVPELSVLENILLGGVGQSFFRFFRKKAEKAHVEHIFSVLGITINVDTPGSELTSSQEIWVCLASLLYNKCPVLLLDECTSTMTDDEIIHFFTVLRTLTQNDTTVIFISHKLKEVIANSDRIAVMKNGTVSAVYQSYETSSDRLYSDLFPAVEAGQARESADINTGVVFSISDATYRDRNTTLIKNLGFSVHRGETLAITGLRESGLEIIEDMICGLVPLSGGQIEFRGMALKKPDIHMLRSLGLAYIPTSRINRGSCLGAKLWENLLITSRSTIHHKGLVREKNVLAETERKIVSFQIKGTAESPLEHLSGGNIQKVIAARELNEESSLVVFSEPSWGLDAHSKRMMYAKLEKIKRNGGAAIILSTDMEEVLSQSDRVLVIHNRQPFGEYRTDSLDSHKLGKLMFGIRDEEKTDE
ncbi:MAG: ATP-binding cassette domain-containing protein [Spirochaetales bacterium]|nr:ATP-binding cassette domain-containing protein [Spirochaetales bacterium]